MRHFERRHEWMRTLRLREFFQIEHCRFFEISQGFFDGSSLADRTNLRAIGDKDAVFFMDDCGEHAIIVLQPVSRWRIIRRPFENGERVCFFVMEKIPANAMIGAYEVRRSS